MGSEDWNEFLELLGAKIQLKGWQNYNAGLDVKGLVFFFVEHSVFHFREIPSC